ncbi:helicase, putative [Brugia malayi]|uniref:Helicase, putative n=1 Tax=Brugia malayi TaxID=6279 RepID=A0A4E9EX18_BRUMA|nr:helicase, putative [Brugia malayi]VIO88479.1 helicase, putative [Brugia malayi]
MDLDIWLKNSKCCSKNQESTVNDNYKDAKMLEKEIQTEAEFVFRNGALKLIAECVKEYGISETYRIPKPLLDIECLKDQVLQNSASTLEIQTLRDLRSGKVTGYIEVLNDKNAKTDDAKTSMSLTRSPDPKGVSNFMGSASNIPFMPGGFDAEIENVLRLKCSISELLFCIPGINVDGLTEGDIHEIPQNSVHCADDNLADLLESVNISNPTCSSRTLEDDSEGAEESHNESEIGKEVDKEFEQLVITLDEVAPSSSGKDELQVQNREYSYAHVLNTSKNVDEYEVLKSNMARKYPFELDPFQQQAVVCLDRGDSVFVAAHTSAGKTVVAEYAVALCNLHKTRAIYTSPIKALSNQKFREFKLIFQDVGLITGDIQLHPEAFCLIMTTEVLRSMLYNGSEVIRELEWVIFDEVHYINDAERGHVWEEVLIMLPAHAKIVMLSATVPNCVEFADWVGRIKKKRIYVIMTARRPVPLEHFLYTGQDGKTKKDMFKIIDSCGQFVQKGYSLASAAKANIRKASANVGPDKNVYITVIDHLRMQNMLPVIVFVFSRRRCDDNAYLLRSIDLTTEKEKSSIHHFFSRCIARLRGSDKNLPQVLQMKELCKHGFAIHHSGILPILKEVVELLFQKGLVKVLFATETFAMGVNMPARTVIFDSLQKHDGRQLRLLNPGEYIQMAGRAGRRGLDATGSVIVLCKGPYVPDYLDLVNCMQGKPTKLESRFRVTYSMLLNLLRVEHLSVEDVLRRSYVESASLRLALTQKARLKQTEELLLLKKDPDCTTCFPTEGNSIVDYYENLRIFIRYRAELWPELIRFSVLDKLLLPGRLVIVCLPEIGRLAAVAVLLKLTVDGNSKNMALLLSVVDDQQVTEHEKQKRDRFTRMPQEEQQEICETSLLQCAAFYGLEGLPPQKFSDQVRRIGTVVDSIPLSRLIAVCQKTMKIDPLAIIDDMKTRNYPRNRTKSPDQAVLKLIGEIDNIAANWDSTKKGNVKLPGQDIQVNDVEMFQKLRYLNDLRNLLINDANFACQRCSLFQEHFTYIHDKRNLQGKCDELRLKLSTGGLLLSQDYSDRIKLLRRLNYIDDSNLVSLKGRVACEIHHQELLITELMLDNKFHYRSTAEIAAMLSVTTCQHRLREGECRKDKEGEAIQTPPVLEELKDDIIEVCNRIGRIQRECGVKDVDISEELSFGLMHAVYEWASSMPFAEIMQLTDAQEGLIVRCIQRLDELCHDIRNAARLVGDPTLYEKMDDTSAAIRRDIVFAASLYTVLD